MDVFDNPTPRSERRGLWFAGGFLCGMASMWTIVNVFMLRGGPCAINSLELHKPHHMFHGIVGSPAVSPSPQTPQPNTAQNTLDISSSPLPQIASLSSSVVASPSASITTSPTPAAAQIGNSRSPSASPCVKALCDEATTRTQCEQTCSCVWKEEKNFCYMLYSGRLLIGPEDPIPIEPVWDGTYDTLPKPLPPGFGGEPAPHAKGKFAYVTMISPLVPWMRSPKMYNCLGLALLNSIKQTNPAPNIDLVLVVLLSDDDRRFENRNRNVSEADIPQMLGEKFYKAFQDVGVNKFVLWKEMDVKRTIVSGGWKQAFSKLQMWTLIDYERIVFMDADKLVFRNMDHLFQMEGDFIAPGDWNCRNTHHPMFPAGGFWVLKPSMKTFNIIEKYISGPDPCGDRWYQGDQIMPRLLFTDVSYWAGPENTLASATRGEPVARWDGDVNIVQGSINRRHGRCSSYAGYNSHPSHRVDAVITATGERLIPPKSTWVMLNMSYDITAGVCDDQSLIDRGDNRYFIGIGGWDAMNPYSVHLNCYDTKPMCEFDAKLVESLHPCSQEIFHRFYGYLKGYNMTELLESLPADMVAHGHGGYLSPSPHPI